MGKMVSSAWDVLSLRFWENPRGGVQWAAGEKSRLGGEIVESIAQRVAVAGEMNEVAQGE